MSQSPHQLMFNLYNIIALTGDGDGDDDDGGQNNDNDSDDEVDDMIVVKVTINPQRSRATPCYSSPI